MRTTAMRRRRMTAIAVSALLSAGVLTAPASAQPQPGTLVQYNVVAVDGASAAQVERAVTAAGATTILERNDAVGLWTVAAPATGFADRVRVGGTVSMAAPVQVIGRAPDRAAKKRTIDAIEKERGGNVAPTPAPNSPGPGSGKPAGKASLDPLDERLWGLRSIHADLARDKTIGDKRVTIGILDDGVDGQHPDIAPNFDRGLSRNFVKDIPYDELGQEVDGPCEYPSCVDPVDVNQGGHGTHVAGTAAAAANSFGVSGVAPGVSIVSIRGGQDSGLFFLQPVVNALTYAGDVGLNVVNMSFYVDPWLYNCHNNPADTPLQRIQQRITKIAMTRALRYAHAKGVTLIAAYGNEATDSGAPKPDTLSPDFPAGTAHDRTIDNATCQSMPSEGPNVISVASYGPSGAKADYSTYGLENISVSAPGGFLRDFFGTPRYNQLGNNIMSTWPRAAAETEGLVDASGAVTPAGQKAGLVKLDRPGAYYRPLQGTSMAAPHAAGVAALVISTYGTPRGGRLDLSPDAVRAVLEGTATKTPCPTPRTVDYTPIGRPADWTATCVEAKDRNGFYGHGRINAEAAVIQGSAFVR